MTALINIYIIKTQIRILQVAQHMFIYQVLMTDGDFVVKIVLILAFVLAAVAAIVMHEFSHAYVAKLNGDYTAKLAGRLTLNPAKHFDPIGLLMMLLVGFGWAKPVPINSDNFTNYKRGMLTVSAAGVTMNLLMSGLGLLLLFLLMPMLYVAFSGNVAIVYLQYFVRYFLEFSVIFGFMLALFNLLPVYPLDGYNIIATLFPKAVGFRNFMVRYGTWILLGYILLSNVFDMLNLWYLDIFGMFNSVINKLLDLTERASLSIFLQV